MADEKTMQETEQQEGPQKDKAKKGSKKVLMIFAAGMVVVLAAGGFFGYRMLSKGKEKGEQAHASDAAKTKSVLVAVDPFVVNLAEQGRYLKITMQFEMTDQTSQEMVTQKMPNIRDAVITLLSSKSTDSVSSPEGKMVLKDELLLRSNQAVGKDVFSNLFYTEFVMQ